MKRLMKKPVLIGLGALLAAVAVGAAVFVLVLKPSAGAQAEGPDGGGAPVQVEGRLGPRLTLESRVFNLVTAPGEKQTYVKLETVIEFETADVAWADVMLGCPSSPHDCTHKEDTLLDEFEQRVGSGVTLIEDAVTSIVSSRSLADVATPEGKEALREDIRSAVTTLIPHPRVQRVLFTDFVTQ